ncbi:MAG: iron-containing alcohol dehydrogenase [Victivallales bacterium]|nr:iron-containing alcohol dehydrogenase [Victivallales bacterium]
MLNFEFCNPVHLVFGKNVVARLAELLPPEIRIMMLYGGGSIKKNGAYDQTMAALQERDVIEFGGIEPNPHYETCMRAVDIIRRENVGFLVAVGGGSVIDAAKFIAVAALFPRSKDPWDILSATVPPTAALPLGCILTLPATGSEMNCNAVISRLSSREKLAFGNPLVYPKFAIIDPQFSFTLPERQTANGIVDAMIHVFEQYLTYPAAAPLQDYMAEGILKTLIATGPYVMEHPHDYDARANVCWCSTMALNGLIACGVPQDWATHMLGHELTALYQLDHARTLAIVLPALWRYQRRNKAEKLLRYGREVWGIEHDQPDEAIEATIAATEKFFHRLKVPTHLADYRINAEEAATEIRRRFADRGTVLGENNDIGADAAYEIIRRC